MSDDLITWLRAQLDEDERVAKQDSKMSDQRLDWGNQDYEDAYRRIRAQLHTVLCGSGMLSGEPCSCDGPDRVLAEVDAKRRIIDAADHTLEFEDYGHAIARTVLELLALPYAGRDGYREEWRP